MKINLLKMQDRVDKLMEVFTSIVYEIDEQTEELEKAINAEEVIISEAEDRKREYVHTIAKRAALKDKILSIVE